MIGMMAHSKTESWLTLTGQVAHLSADYSLTLLIFAVSFVMPGINHGRNYTVEDLIKSLLFIPYYNSDGNLFSILSVGWTLIIEVYDYIIFWAVYRFLRRFKYRDVLALLIMSGTIIFGCVLKLYLHNSPILDIWTNKYQLSFILGLFLSCLKQYKGTSEKKYIVTWPYILIGFAVVFYILCYRIPDNYAWISAFVLVAASVSVFKEIEFPQWSVHLGNMSYSVYLIHKFVIAVAEKNRGSCFCYSDNCFCGSNICFCCNNSCCNCII